MLILGLVIFIGIHLLPTWQGLRARLITRIGIGAYKAFFSIIAAISLVLIWVGFANSPHIEVFNPPSWGYKLVPILMLPALILLVAAYIPCNIRRVVKHPMLIGIKLWALGHLLANGDVASLLLFGSLLAFAVFDMISVKRRKALPARPKQPIYMDAITVISGILLFGFIMHIHLAWFGYNTWHW